jgi:hypothetical protein
LQVELLDGQGRPLPGFTRADCAPLRGDHAALVVHWKGGARAPEGARQARFYLKRAFLYGFEFGKADRGNARRQQDANPEFPAAEHQR